jgi:hypothetical protein
MCDCTKTYISTSRIVATTKRHCTENYKLGYTKDENLNLSLGRARKSNQEELTGKHNKMSMNNIQIPNVTATAPVTQSLYNTLGNANLEMAGLQRLTSSIASTNSVQSSANQASRLSQGLVFDIKDMKGRLLEMTPAEAAAKGITIKNGDQILVDGRQPPPMPAGSGFGGNFQQGQGTSFNINPTQAWNGAGAFPQYAVGANGQISPYINFLDRTAGAGMQFGLPPSINDMEANLKGIDPYGYAQGGGGMSLAQENAQLKAMIAQLTGGGMPPAAGGGGPVTLGSMRTNMSAPRMNNPALMARPAQGSDLDPTVILSLMKEFGITPEDLVGTNLSTVEGATSPSTAVNLPLVK